MIDNPLVKKEFDRITGSGNKLIVWELVATLIVDNQEIHTFPNVSGERYTANYAEDIGPYHFLIVNTGITVLRDLIYPNINKLNIRLTKRYKAAKLGSDVVETKSIDYVAFLTDAQDVNKIIQSRRNKSIEEEDFENFIPLNFQLIERNLFVNMNRDVSGVYEGRVDTCLFTQLGIELKDNQNTTALAGEKYSGLRGLKTEVFDNHREYDNIIVNNVRLNELTSYLQNKYGISSYGIGTFYSRGFWYVSPLFKHDRFNKKQRTITIYDFPTSELPSVDKSFVKNDNKLFVLGTGTTRNINNSVSTEVNDGNGIRIIPADYYDKDFYQASGNKVTTGASKKTREFIAKESGHGIYNVKYARSKFTANPFPEISKIKAGQGGLLTVTWSHGDVNELEPFMPGKIYYEKNGELTSVEGTLIAVKALTTTASSILADNDYKQVLELTFHYREE